MSADRDPQAKPATLDDVAAHASVSAQTVSRVINGKEGVAQATRDRVLDAIAALGYRPNALARGLATNQSRTIGLLVADFAQGFFPDTTRGIEHEAADLGYSVYLATISEDAQRVRGLLDRLRDDRFAGVIMNTSVSGHEATFRQAAREGFPIVLVHEELDGVKAVVNWPGYRTGGLIATQHLISTGRRRIAYLGTQAGSLSDQDKLEGYQAALDMAGIPFDPRLLFRCTRDFQSGYAAVAEILNRCPDVDAIVSASDVRAVGALRYLTSHGIEVPDQIAIVSFGASTMATMVTPSLSSIAVPRRAIGQTAVQLLIDMLGGAEPDTRYVHEQPYLILGESSMKRPTRLQARVTSNTSSMQPVQQDNPVVTAEPSSPPPGSPTIEALLDDDLVLDGEDR